MTTNKLQEILQSDKKLTVSEVQKIIWELKQDAFRESCKHLAEPKTMRWYDGEVNGFQICLDLLEKLEVEDAK